MWLVVLFVLAATVTAQARPGDRYTVEFSVLPSIEFVSGSGLGYTDYYYDTGRFTHTEGYTAYLFDCPQYRISLWSTSPIVVDFAFQIIDAPVERFGDDYWLVLGEAGISVDLGRGDNPLRPFIGPTVGVMSSTFQGVAGMVGGRAGLRCFVRDWADVRIQIDYRAGVADRPERINVLGLTAGLGFFL
jgi:hypothetical protein